MSRVDFYHLQRQSLDNVLPILLQKSYSTGKRCVVKTGKKELIEDINSQLWTFQDDGFLPHGSKKDGFAAEQPIWLTFEDDNPNNADYLFLVEGAEANPEELAAYERIFYVFDGNIKESLEQARNSWKTFKSLGHEIFYWQQENGGKWEQKVYA